MTSPRIDRLLSPRARTVAVWVAIGLLHATAPLFLVGLVVPAIITAAVAVAILYADLILQMIGREP